MSTAADQIKAQLCLTCNGIALFLGRSETAIFGDGLEITSELIKVSRAATSGLVCQWFSVIISQSTSKHLYLEPEFL